MIIYIHGFASSGFGTKAQEFKKYYNDEIICLSLPTISVKLPGTTPPPKTKSNS